MLGYFGTVSCRSLGVHISFVRSIAMDSWTPAQLSLMKAGGNGKCSSYLSSNGVLPSTPIKPKYESRVAQHYKDVLKARVSGKPDPPLPSVSVAPSPARSKPRGGAPGEDPNGMERLTGESDEEYIARQTRLRAEAKSRMAAKFGGGGGRMGGVGSGGGSSGRMAGIGSDSSYNPNAGYGGGMGSNIDVDSIVSGFGSAFSTLGAFGRSSIQTASAALQDQESMQQFTGTVKSSGMSLWNSVASAANDITANLTEPDGSNDGFSDLRAHVQQEKMNKTSNNLYEGFGSDNNWGSATNSNANNLGGTTQPNFAMKKNDNIGAGGLANPAVVRSGTTMTSTSVKKKMSNDDFFSSFGA